MKKLKIYLDTFVINFLFADDSPEFKAITLDFFNKYISTGIYSSFVSDVVVSEINKTETEEKKVKLLTVIKEYAIPLVLLNEEAENLAQVYLAQGAVPKSKTDDARHIALSSIHNFDVLLSWNFKHLANVNKRNKIKIINEQQGYYYPIDLLTPLQLMYEAD